jgi:putative ABC transport system permease protein
MNKLHAFKTLQALYHNLPFEAPLAWSQLSHQKLRLLIALSGIAFANILIFMQLGFRALFTEGATLIADNLQGDLFVLSPQTNYLGAGNFPRVQLYRVAAIEGVELVRPVYVSYGRWSYSKKIKTWSGQVLAFNPSHPVFNLPEANQQLWKLKLPNTVLVDRQSKPTDFGPVAQRFKTDGPFSALLNNRQVQVVGLFSLGSSFFRSDGNIIMSETNYQTLFGADALTKVSVGVVKLKPGANVAAIRAALAAEVPAVQVFNHKELVTKDLSFQEQNPAGSIFAFGAVMGFIVGVVVVYQVLYADVTDHLPEYATLKAMGYSDGALLIVIFQEALILGVMGFLPGFVASLGMYNFLAGLTRLALVMRVDVAVTVFLLTLMMCTFSAAIASSKLRSADPADVFS